MSSMTCIVGVDTDIGKTIVTAALLRASSALGVKTLGLKPVQTGAPEALDTLWYGRAAPGVPALTLEAFAKPCSPHLAAALENRRLDAADLIERIRTTVQDADAEWTLVEGAGGWLTPINDRETVADADPYVLNKLTH